MGRCHRSLARPRVLVSSWQVLWHGHGDAGVGPRRPGLGKAHPAERLCRANLRTIVLHTICGPISGDAISEGCFPHRAKFESIRGFAFPRAYFYLRRTIPPPLDPGLTHKNPSRHPPTPQPLPLAYHVPHLACLTRLRPGGLQPGCLHAP